MLEATIAHIIGVYSNLVLNKRLKERAEIQKAG
jgi:hypothetical protein